MVAWAGIAGDLGLVEQSMDLFQLVGQFRAGLPGGGFGRHPLERHADCPQLQKLRAGEKRDRDRAAGTDTQHAFGDELEEGFSHRRDAGVQPLRHIAEDQARPGSEVAQNDSGADFAQHLGGEIDVFDVLHGRPLRCSSPGAARRHRASCSFDIGGAANSNCHML